MSKKSDSTILNEANLFENGLTKKPAPYLPFFIPVIEKIILPPEKI
jgi:hypothetical protein